MGDAEIPVKQPIGQLNSVAELRFGMFFACLESFVWSMIVVGSQIELATIQSHRHKALRTQP